MSNSTPKSATPSAIESTQFWLKHTVIGENFCPFAKREVERDTIRYCVETSTDAADQAARILAECRWLDVNPSTQTTLVILEPEATPAKPTQRVRARNTFDVYDFDHFLALYEECVWHMQRQDYEGIYQLATFHPDYQFASEPITSASHYTNRSPFPTLHILREDSLERAIESYKQPELIPENNIARAEARGADYFKALLTKAKLADNHTQ